MANSLKVVFRSDVRGIATAGDVKNVSAGYARNFLFPRKLAFLAKEGTLRQWETERQGTLAKAGRLRAMDMEFRFRHQPELGKLLVTLLYLGKQRTRGHGNDRVVRNAPAELFQDLVTHALGAFGIIRPHVDVHERPREFAGDFGA